MTSALGFGLNKTKRAAQNISEMRTLKCEHFHTFLFGFGNIDIFQNLTRKLYGYLESKICHLKNYFRLFSLFPMFQDKINQQNPSKATFRH